MGTLFKADSPEPEELKATGLTMPELKQTLDSKNIEYPSNAKKDELTKILGGGFIAFSFLYGGNYETNT